MKTKQIVYSLVAIILMLCWVVPLQAQSTESMMSQGNMLLSNGAFDQAVSAFRKVMARDPSNFEAQFNLGRLYGLRGNLDRQQELYEAALSSNPEFIRGYFFLAKLLMDRDGDLERAEKLARDGLSRDPESKTGPLAHYLLADILNRTGRQVEAMKAVNQARAIEARQSSGAGG